MDDAHHDNLSFSQANDMKIRGSHLLMCSEAAPAVEALRCTNLLYAASS